MKIATPASFKNSRFEKTKSLPLLIVLKSIGLDEKTLYANKGCRFRLPIGSSSNQWEECTTSFYLL